MNRNRSVATRTVDARGWIVAPGFIDMMGDDSLLLVLDRASAASKLLEGVTTISVSEGNSLAPQNAQTSLTLWNMGTAM